MGFLLVIQNNVYSAEKSESPSPALPQSLFL